MNSFGTLSQTFGPILRQVAHKHAQDMTKYGPCSSQSNAQTISTILQNYLEELEKSSFNQPNLAKFASSRDFPLL